MSENDKDRQDLGEKNAENLPDRYVGSGENRNPIRMMKIEEIVKWDMNFGVTVGPAGYDHRLRCPYCGKKLVLLFHEGGRDRTGIRVCYRCESCNAHSLVSFTPPGHKFTMPEVEFGERVVIEKPTPIPPERPERERSSDRSERGNQDRPRRERNSGRANAGNTQETHVSPAARGSQQGNVATSNSPDRRANNSPMQRGQQRSGNNPTQPATERGQSSSRPEHRNSRPPRANSSNFSQTPNPNPQAGTRSSKTAPPDTPNNINELSEIIQDQADKQQTRAKPYQRRRRRPFRPPTTSTGSKQ